MVDLQSLISRLEKAEGPDRELDLAIYAALIEINPNHRGPALGDRQRIQRYTASLDSAVGLVPEGSIWHVGRNQKYENIPSPIPFWGRPYNAWVGSGENEWGVTPAIALCIAALRTRAREES